MKSEPNKPPEFWIESIEVKRATYMGNAQPLRCKFSPFLNTIIGGRGSGKSTLLEFMRLVLHRKSELPANLVPGNEKYYARENGLLKSESVLNLIYRKGDTRYRLTWPANLRGAFFAGMGFMRREMARSQCGYPFSFSGIRIQPKTDHRIGE